MCANNIPGNSEIIAVDEETIQIAETDGDRWVKGDTVAVAYMALDCHFKRCRN